MKLSILNLIKRLNWVSLVQSCWVVLALFISIAQAKAQSLIDPTTPPESVIELMPKSNQDDSLEWKLQGLKAEGKQSIAIVDGQWIALGKEYQGYRLIQVTQTQALFLSKTGNRKTLSLALKSFQTPPKTIAKRNKKQTEQYKHKNKSN